MNKRIKAKDVILDDTSQIIKSCIDEFRILAGTNILLTGGAGFLGYYLVHSLDHWNSISEDESDKINVMVLDNFIRGVPEWLKDFETSNYIKLIKHDITDILPDEVMGQDFNFIIHAASIASPIYYRKNPIITMDANTNGLRSLLDYCIDKKHIKGVLNFSTSEIYGDPSADNIPTCESYRGNVSCTGPRACYDESKRYGETLCVNFFNEYNIPVKSVRPFNNYGPGLKITDGRALPDFARKVIANEDIVMYSDGLPTRTFCYITDAISGYIKTLVKGRAGEAYNIGIDKPEISIMELANITVDIARDLFNYDGKIITALSDDKEYLTDNPNRRCPNIDKAKKELNFNPTVGIHEGIKKSLIWYNSNNSAENA